MKKNILFLSLLLWAAPLPADTVYMDSGEILEGTIVSRNEQMVTIQTQGGREEINKRFIKRITDSAIKQSTATQEIQVNEAPKTNPAPEVQPIQSSQGNEDPSWKEYNSNKHVAEMPVSKTGTMMKENIVKLSLEFSGKYHASTTLSAAGNSVTGSATEDTLEGVALTGETLEYLDDNVGLGVGASYQIPRKMKDYNGLFNFTPFYGIFKIRSKPTTQRTYFYGVTQLGYNLLFGDDNFKGSSGSLSGGIYFGLGVGWIIDKMNIEFLYSVNRGSLQDSEYIYYDGAYYNVDLKSDIEYSQINMKVGVNF